MKLFLAVALGGALGALSRSLLSDFVYNLAGKEFPYGTLCVNIVGSFIIGVLYIVLSDKMNNGALASMLITGFLGALTTFSTFSLDTVKLLENGRVVAALANVSLNIAACLFAVWIGISLMRMVTIK
ncbi:MAG: fluoride efflux transporter CrcB [Gammaproteobacteria bacterium]|nr:MAG: fluoride efflux transporter CrcB [Gammaproteobacteria bacterium]